MQICESEELKKAVAGNYTAIRRVMRLEPQGEKIFPPTYEGGEYADEDRNVRMDDGAIRTLKTFLLDSVQSQANRMELALLRAYHACRLKMPLVQVDFAGDGREPVLKDVGHVTALEAPHRICDAIFRDAVMNGKAFRESEIGSRLNAANAANATPVFELCPTALIFGFWDSTGPRGGLGAKVQRALVSEIVGYDAVTGKRPASRIDPLQIENNLEIYRKKGGGWTLDKSEAEIKNGEPVRTKPSDQNHGNITPSLYHDDEKTKKRVLNHGGITLTYAMQHTVLSLAALRRLRFPIDGNTTAERDNAARTVLAALALVAVCFLDEEGFDLRSRCLLDGKPGAFEFVGRGETKPFALDADKAIALLNAAVEEAMRLSLPWAEAPITLQPSANLKRLVIESRTKSMASAAGA